MAINKNRTSKCNPQATAGTSKFRTRWRHIAEIDRKIRTDQAPNCNDLMAELEVSRRTILRDIDFMRNDLGAPIEYDYIKNGYVYSEINWSMPNISITEGDLLAIAIAAKAIESFGDSHWSNKLAASFAKLTSCLPKHVCVDPKSLASRYNFGMEGISVIDGDILEMLNKAIRDNRRIKMTYRRLNKNDHKEYLAEPYLLLQRSGAWYLAARDSQTGLVPMFNISRIKKLKLLESHFEYDFSDFDKDKYLREMAWTFHNQDKIRVVIQFTGMAAELVGERIWHPSQKIKQTKNGVLRFEVTVNHLWDIFPWILRWGSSAKVIQPAKLKRLVRDEIQNMAKNY